MKVNGKAGAWVEFDGRTVRVRRLLREGSTEVGKVQGCEVSLTRFEVTVAGGGKPFWIPIFPWQYRAFRDLADEIRTASQPHVPAPAPGAVER